MKKTKKPEKIILDFSYEEHYSEIKERIRACGYPCESAAAEECNFYTDSEKGSTDGGSHILYITDDASKARKAKEAGAAVLIYLHPGNAGESFGGFRFCIEGFEDADATYYTRIYQREKHIPWTIGETERLIIREMVPGDTEALYDLYKDKSVVTYMEDLPENREDEEVYIREYIDKVYAVFGFGMWVILLKETGELLGRVGFQNSEEENVVEIGFMISSKHRNQGYAYEACRAALGYMKEEYDYLQIRAKCHKDNRPAICLCKRLGVECITTE